MSTAVVESAAARIVHWTACLLGTAVVLLFVAFAIGEGPPPLAEMNAMFAAIGVMLVGFLVAWWKDWLGGLVSLAGIGAFYALNYTAEGAFPSGWVFPLCFVPGVLALLAGLMRRFST